MERKQVIDGQVKAVEQERSRRVEQDPAGKRNAMVLMLSRIVGLGRETAELLVHEMLARDLRDRKAVARYAGLTGSPDESGSKRRDKGLARAGNGRVRTLMIQLSWRMLQFHPESELVSWYRKRTEDGKGSRKKLIVALARKLVIALWRYVNTGAIPAGLRLHPLAAAGI